VAEMKTKVNDASVDGFLAKVANATRREDARALLAMMKGVTRAAAFGGVQTIEQARRPVAQTPGSIAPAVGTILPVRRGISMAARRTGGAQSRITDLTSTAPH
jgi:hypothetical protein